jgi:hypothetical protein
LLAVAVWTAATSLFLVVRLGMAFYMRLTSGPLRTWMLDIDQAAYDKSLAAKMFTQRRQNSHRTEMSDVPRSIHINKSEKPPERHISGLLSF